MTWKVAIQDRFPLGTRETQDLLVSRPVGYGGGLPSQVKMRSPLLDCRLHKVIHYSPDQSHEQVLLQHLFSHEEGLIPINS
jgi:hypothetical protein